MSTIKKNGPSAERRRRNLQARLNKMVQEEEDDTNKERIAQLEAALKQKDEVLAGLTKDQLEEMDVMDIDTEDADPDASGQEESEQPKITQQDEKNKGLNQGVQVIDLTVEDSKPPIDSKPSTGDVKPSVEVDDDRGNNLFDPNDSGFESGEDEDGKALYILGPRPSEGEEIQTVGWAEVRGNSKLFINRFGKKSAARYRIQKFAYPPDYEKRLPPEEKVSNSGNRFGDVKDENGNLKYTRRHILGIFGVAWPGENTKDFSLMDPKRDRTHIVEGRVVKERWVLTYVWTAWDIDGRVVKKWEPRQTLRSRYGKIDADKGIFKASEEAEDRYAEAMSGQRRANSRTPSVGLAQTEVDRQREMSLGVGRSTRSPPPAATSGSAKSSVPAVSTGNLDIEKLRIEFLCDWMELLGLGSEAKFENLERSQKLDCLAAWKEEKQKNIAVA